MKNLFCLSIFVFCSLFFASTAAAQCQGTVYITSLTWQTANSVQSYTSTELDYCAGLYYDPAVSGGLTEGYGTGYASIGQGYTQGSGNSIPARLDFGYAAPINNLTYTTNGDHYVITYYLVYIPTWNNYYWYDPWNLGFGEIGGGYEQVPDYFGYFSYVSYWVSSPQYVGSTSQTITYTGQTQCLPGQLFTTTGQPCSSIPECQPGQQFTTTGETCPNYVPPPEPPAQPVVSVALGTNFLCPKGTSCSKNEPVVTCISGVPDLAGRTVNLKLVRDTSNPDFDGGHKEAFHTSSRPLGTLGKSSGITGPDGCYRTTYYPPHISGVFRIKSTISGITSDEVIGVWFPNLTELTPGTNYTLIGADSAHPVNHYGTFQARGGLIQIANDYATEFYGGTPPENEKIAYNDMSLMLGGKFDLGKNWSEKGDHAEHREGINCDTRSNNIPQSRWARLKTIFYNRGSTRTKDHTSESRPHWHLRFEFNFATVETPDSQMQNGIEQNFKAFVEYNDVSRTPSTFVTDAGEAIFDRQITQEEFEGWFPSMANAKAQGPNIFLQEVRTFEKQLFVSPEYIARQRTDVQFVQDVFASHLFREPTTQESSYWLDYLLSIGGTQEIATDPTEPNPRRTRTPIPSLSRQQKRQMFLNNFQALPDFVNMVSSIVDEAHQEPLH